MKRKRKTKTKKREGEKEEESRRMIERGRENMEKIMRRIRG